MAITPDGRWQPDLSKKQFEVFNSYAPYLLVEGPRETGKTVACLHRLLRHAWEIPMARIGIFAKTRKSAEQGGVFTDLTETIIPIWLEANIGMRVATGKKDAPMALTDGATRILYLDVTNMHGGKSRIQLHSLDFDWDVEAALRSTRFSMLYFSELSNFKDRIVFTISTGQLRMPHLRDEDHQFLCDSNPCEGGEQSWQWKLFHGERLAENHPYPTEQAKYSVIHIGINDNPFLSEGRKNAIAARHAHDPDLMNRYYHGLWTTRTEDGLFSDVFMTDTHVVGNVRAFDESDWELLLPSETCSTLITGWDIGGSKNHSAHIIERIGPPGDKNSIFSVLDEAVSVNTMLTVEDFTERMAEMWDKWLNFIRTHFHQNPIEQRHWSDTTAFNNFRAALGGFDHTIVAMASEGRFMLAGAPKSKGSVMKRVDLVRRLLFQNRLYVSAHCLETIKMLGSLKAGKTKMEVIERSDALHVFDSLSYALASELVSELAESWTANVGRVDGLVSIKM